MDLTTIREAVARGWCSPVNSHKEMDADLASAIADEVLAALRGLGQQREGPTEEQVERAAKVIADSPLIDAPTLPEPCWRGLARSILEAAYPPSAAPEMVMGWVSVEERLPKSGEFVLAFANDGKRTRRVRAMYVAKESIEADEESINNEAAEYDEDEDEYWLREGWYECNEYEETHWRVDDPVTHWMPLPAAPHKETP